MTGGRHPEFDNIVMRLLRGQFQWYSHTRLQVTIVNAEGEETLLPHPVLNEVLLSALDPAKPSILDVGIEDQVREVVRCSGIIVSTGTGSTAWFDSVTRVHADVVEEVLRRSGLEVDQQLVNNILKSIEGAEHFPVHAEHLAYAIREPIINRYAETICYRSVKIAANKFDEQSIRAYPSTQGSRKTYLIAYAWLGWTDFDRWSLYIPVQLRCTGSN